MFGFVNALEGKFSGGLELAGGAFGQTFQQWEAFGVLEVSEGGDAEAHRLGVVIRSSVE